MDAMQNLLQRRSIRKYTDQQVPEALLDQILEAGIYAPSGMNRQGSVLVAVTDKETRDRLAGLKTSLTGANKDPFYGAPCVVVVLADPEHFTWEEDGSLVMGNLLNAAHAVGLGSCWIHRAREMFDSEEGKALLREWGLPESLRGVGNCILGYSAENPEPKERKNGRIVKIK